ncbi:hypothetical protein [Algoriphagus zhangzhouensis]|uniref:Methyltransferase domain-containing protein n=1 Tax=Algoriphagus zhangzhouensis TaxID=1073327 RepID=A0A1M7ZD56_9BACT|nr:hypothetical protein [Algoriphagus zhangzhouensis]TDY45740.1 hypothetical protein A8938_2344 [Algoriphagus zhangzhouensis]SHO62828.1 hypothetical protein SAMN04488108_2341 [Algoriphagus zhangzhouensis]
MGRVHLFEFEDQSWFPDFLRNYGTDFLQFLSNKTNMYKPIIPLISNILQKQGIAKMIDLGSGGGGGLIRLNEELLSLHLDLKIILTDLYPNFSAFEYTKEQASNFEYYPKPVDARNVPEDLKGLRTQFLSFHHFRTKDAIQILQNAVNSDESIAIFEAQERSIPSVLAMIFSPITVLLTTPFIRPFKWGRIIFTYLIPIVPIFVLWDGVVSAFRTYSADEMNQLISQVENHETYNWEVNKIKSGPGVILYLIGTKK